MNNVFVSGFGQLLRNGREAKGLSTVDVASKLKLTARQIEALEAEDFQHLPGEVFVRGFVRNYARLVDISPESLLNPMDAIATVSETITAPSEGLTFRKPGMQQWVVLPALIAALFLGLVALLYHWLREGEDALVEQPVTVQPLPAPVAPSAPALVPETPAAEGAAAAPGTSVPPASDAAGAGAVPVPATVSPAVTPPSAPNTPSAPASAASVKPAGGAAIPPVVPAVAPPKTVVPPAAAPAPVPAKPQESAPTPAKHAGAPVLRFAASADAWIQVVDGKGKRFSKLVKSGSSESFSGEAPFRLVVGEARQVKLTYNGHSVDLVPFIGEKVARLTLE